MRAARSSLPAAPGQRSIAASVRGAGALGEIAPKGKVQATAGFAFTPDHRRWGEFHAQLSRMPRPGSSVMLQVGDQPFLLVARDDWAWSRGPLQEQAIIAAVRAATGMRDRSARRAPAAASPIRYLLDGAPTAIDAAAARCASRRWQSRADGP